MLTHHYSFVTKLTKLKHTKLTQQQKLNDAYSSVSLMRLIKTNHLFSLFDSKFLRVCFAIVPILFKSCKSFDIMLEDLLFAFKYCTIPETINNYNYQWIRHFYRCYATLLNRYM